ncbi:MAG: hypothetical protein KJ939_00785 [Nanoarchaeota archaeon]|nr:hypothetical protein [Nanoarchaeota archaeon]MBU4351602.1 hypothetical protein [Nanoarchaeota archaeon]
MYQDINYNLFVGILPEEVRLDRISEVFSERLRKLPIKEHYNDPYHGIKIMEYNAQKSKKVLHKSQKRRFFNFKSKAEGFLQ